jgi:hypothetical protein
LQDSNCHPSVSFFTGTSLVQGQNITLQKEESSSSKTFLKAQEKTAQNLHAR